MPMKAILKLVLSFACLALLASCSPDESPIRILGAHALSGGAGECSPNAEVTLTRGSLDISGSRTYLAQFQLRSDLQQISTSVSGEVIAGPGRNDFIGEEFVLSYTSTPALSFDAAERVPIHMVVPAGSSDDSWIRDFIITTKAGDRLADQVLPGSPVMLNVSIQINGHLQSGQRVSTNRITFPIEVFNSGFAGCTAPAVRALNGPCGLPGGQDGTVPSCS